MLRSGARRAAHVRLLVSRRAECGHLLKGRCVSAGLVRAIAGVVVIYLSLVFLDETSGTTTRRTIDTAPESVPSADGSDRDRVPTSTDA